MTGWPSDWASRLDRRLTEHLADVLPFFEVGRLWWREYICGPCRGRFYLPVDEMKRSSPNRLFDEVVDFSWKPSDGCEGADNLLQ